MGDAAIFAISAATILASVALVTIIFIVRHELRDWMRRLIRVGPQGAEMIPPAQQQVRADAAERVQQQALIAPPAPAPDPALAFWARQVQEFIDRSGLRGTPELVPQLEHTLALGARLIDFNVTARIIFGTQVSVLLLLSASPAGLTLDDLRPTYQEHVTRVQVGNATFNPDILQWVNFLITQHLVAFENARYHLSPAGREFLQFAASIGVNEGKGG